MLIKLLNELAESVSNNINVSRVPTNITLTELAQDVDVLDRPKILSKASKTLISSAIDAASSNIMTSSNEVALSVGVICSSSKVLAYPDITASTIDTPFAGALLADGVPGITNSYVMLNLRYVDDQDLPTGAISHDIRINMESYMIRKSLDILLPNTLLMIDGPLYYPLHHPLKITCKWNDELSRLNEHRIETIRAAYRYGLLPINIVKRVTNSYYLSTTSRDISDVEFVETLVKNLNVRSKPIRTSTYLYRRGEGPPRYFTYIAIPRSSIYSTYSIFRVEVLKDVYDEVPQELIDELISHIAFEALDYGLGLPYRLNIADSWSKGLISRMTNVFVKMLTVRGFSIPYEVLEYER